jgi:hypothetical protein
MNIMIIINITETLKKMVISLLTMMIKINMTRKDFKTSIITKETAKSSPDEKDDAYSPRVGWKEEEEEEEEGPVAAVG